MRIRPLAGILVTTALLTSCHHGSAESAAPATSAIGIEWRLVSLGGATVGFGSDGQPLTLLLSAESGQASGYAGCNRFTGSYTLSGNALSFGPLAMTRMACSGTDVLEKRYTQALESTTAVAVSGTTLELRKGSTPIVKFTK